MKAAIFFITTALFWGGSFVASYYALEGFSPYFAATLRVAVCLFTALSLGFLCRRGREFSCRPWPIFLVGLFMMGLPWAALYWGMQYVEPAIGSILNGTVAIFVVLLSPLITPQDTITLRKKIGVLIGFIGIVVIFYPDIGDGLDSYAQGLLALLFMAICYGVGVLGSRILVHSVGHFANLSYQCVGALLFLLPLTLVTEVESLSLVAPLSSWLAILYLGVCSTAFGWLMFFYLIRHLGSVEASAVGYCVPLVGILLDWVMLGHVIPIHQALGAVVILSGVFLINQPKRRAA